LLDGGEVELLEGRGVIEIGIQRAGRRGVLVQDGQIQLVRPLVTVRARAAQGFCLMAAGERAFAFVAH